MGVQPRGNSFQATVNYKGERFRRDFPTEIEAETWVLETKANLNKGIRPETTKGRTGGGKVTTLGELADYMAANHWEGTKGGGTAVMNMGMVVKALSPGIKLTDIRKHTLDTLVRYLKRTGNSGATINRKLAAISKALQVAKVAEWISSVPAMPWQKESESRIRWLTEDEEEKVLECLWAPGSASWVGDMVAVALDTGMRQGELLRLEWQDVDLTTRMVHVWVSKSGRARSIPMTTRVVDILSMRKAHGDSHHRFVFNGATKASVQHHWKRARERLGFEEDEQFVFHALRHTFCSRLAQRGANAPTIKELAGHATLEQTGRYMHLAPQTLEAAIQLLDRE